MDIDARQLQLTKEIQQLQGQLQLLQSQETIAREIFRRQGAIDELKILQKEEADHDDGS